MLNQVQYRHDSIVINKEGKPVAALVDARLFERIRNMQASFALAASTPRSRSIRRGANTRCSAS